MRYLMHVLLLVAVSVSVTACGHKGRLKAPAQIEAEEQKKARKEAKKVEEEKKKTPSPLGGGSGSELISNDENNNASPITSPLRGEE